MAKQEVNVSVIVPAFNAGRAIARTIESVLGQDLKGIQLIVVDDGSTDDTLEIAQSVLEPGAVEGRVIRQENRGVSAARNAGMEEATGRYVFFLDADDFIASECLSRLHGRMESCNADIVFCGWDRVDPSGAVLQVYDECYQYIEEPISGREAMVEMLKRNIWIWTGSALYRKDMLKEHDLRFTVGCTGGEDLEFALKAMFHAQQLASVPEALSNYVQRPRERPLEPDTAEKRGLDSLSAHYRLIGYLKEQGADEELIGIVESYVVGWVLPGAVASLSKRRRYYGEPTGAIESYLARVHGVRARDFGWMPSWKCRTKAIVGNWLLRLNPRLFCLVARIRSH
jgi:glycosyltransferase involved in cell wall biosynthesis